MLVTRLAEIGAEVDKAGCEAGAAGVDQFGAFGCRKALTEIGDDPVADQQRAARVEAGRGVEQAGVGDQEVAHRVRL